VIYINKIKEFFNYRINIIKNMGLANFIGSVLFLLGLFNIVISVIYFLSKILIMLFSSNNLTVLNYTWFIGLIFIIIGSLLIIFKGKNNY